MGNIAQPSPDPDFALRSLFRRLAIALPLLAALAAGLPAVAAEDPMPEPANISQMSLKDLESLVTFITTSVGQDSIKLRTLAGSKSCLELFRAANSSSLGYDYLARMTARAQEIGGDASLPLRANLVQARVLVFAARVRAEEFINRACRDFTVPADQAGDQRYQVPARISDPEYATAMVEARDATDANLALALIAARTRQCPRVSSSLEAIALLVPYLDKLAADVQSRPYTFGPRASRRALVQSRNQLVATANRMAAEFNPACIPPKTATAPAAPAAPATPDTPITPETQPAPETPAPPAATEPTTPSPSP
jgi:hypothetical protein